MKTKVNANRIEPGYEPIKGYILEKRIGRGGFGEVWRAEAPGGLKKAVKFVYGQHDQHRAEQELKSLERIKGVQHPFILTLERFELIENQLVIVTELADGSLEDIYKQQRKRGSCGIPREALLGYLRDAADALDYLHQLYKFQHLDIKPGNLLIVGGRVKVADFGLLKDLGEAECSIVGGLTPIYAPPEVFDGRPSVHSDQYSMAVMYQELLTSTRPFSGRTIAQLATQHVHNAPNLKPLPASDRPCVARALEKSPDRRFESCSEFIARLSNPHGIKNQVRQQETEQLQTTAHPVTNLPQINGVNSHRSETDQTHVLVVGLGGTGADCLHQLRSRINEFGTGSPVALHSVLIDTDPMTTQTATLLDATDSIARSHVVNASLRTPNEYRSKRTEKLKTISRRWIYNVPRNGTTGGMRPLGRLALVDHGNEVMETLQSAVEELKSAVADGATPKIYVVASLTGGSGGGMYIDVAYLLRHLLDESALENESILSFLTTNRFQGDPSRPLSLHATKSAISEIAHFLKPGNSYPGDTGAQWPSVPAARTPLDDAYLVAQSSQCGAPAALDSVVNYLWLDATVCSDWFANGRSSDEEQTGNAITARSMSVVQIGDPGDRQASLLAPQATKSLLLRWLGNPRDASESANDFSRRVIRRCYLDAEALRIQTERWLGDSRQDRRRRLTEQIKTMQPSLIKDRRALRSELAKWLAQTIDLEQTEVIAGLVRQQIEAEIGRRLHDGRLNLSSAIAGLTAIAEHIQTVRQELITGVEQDLKQLDQVISGDTEGGIGNALASVRETLGLASAESAESPQKDSQLGPVTDLCAACDVGEQLIQIIAGRAAASAADALEEQLSELSELYSDASARIAQGIQNLNEENGLRKDPWMTLETPVKKQLPEILCRLHDQCVGSMLAKAIQSPSSIVAESFVSALSTAAADVIRQLIDESNPSQDDAQAEKNDCTVTLAGFETANKTTDALPVESSRPTNHAFDSVSMTQTQSWSQPDPNPTLTADAAIEAVRPPLLECGGKQRLYLVCRDLFEQKKFEAQLPKSSELSVTTILARSSMPMLVHEAQGIELKNVLAWLDALTGDDGTISSRLATRCDVEWS